MKKIFPMNLDKWFDKIFALSGFSGYTYDFEVDSGQEEEADLRPPTQPDRG